MGGKRSYLKFTEKIKKATNKLEERIQKIKKKKYKIKFPAFFLNWKL